MVVFLFSEKKGLSKMVLGFYLFSDFFFHWLSVTSHGLVPRMMVKFQPGLSQILSTVFLSKNMKLKLTKYC